MKLRNLTLVAGLLGAFFTNSAFALGMGEIKLNSSLNEPLDAEIQLLNVGDLSELEMLVGLGSREDFEAAGVERAFLLTDLRFKVDMSVPGNPILRVSSRKPIREPYLDFLLEVQWPSGRLLREYTLLLDLPVYATARAPAKKIEAASSSPQPQVPAPVRTVKSSSSSPSTQSGMSLAGGEYRVASGDTAWGIARKIKPNDASIMQSLAAVKQSNPHAFIDGNINLLKQGAVLRLPSSAEIAQLSEQDVNTEVDFFQGNASPVAEADTVPSAQQLDATGNLDEGTEAPSSQGGGRLKLAALGDQSAVSDNVISGDGSERKGAGGVSRDTEALQNDFTIFQEELDKTQRENEELKARLSIMEEQIATMSRLVEINDDTLRAAQVASQQVDEPVSVSQNPADAGQQADADSVVNKSEDSSAAKQVSDVDDSDETEASGIQGWVSMLLYPLIGLLILVLAIVLFFRNRKSDEDEPEEELSLQTLVTAKDDERIDEGIEDLDDILDDEDKELLDEAVSGLDEQELNDLEGLELGEGEDVDPLGEADIYLSLGNYKQAEKVLLNAVDASPADPSLRLKLMEVYVSSNDLDKFDIQYQALADLENSEAGIKADSLRSVLEPDSLQQSEQDDSSKDNRAIDDLELDGLEVDTEVGADKISSNNDLELDLDLDDIEAVSTASEEKLSEELDNLDAKVSELETSEFDLDLDLESLDLENLDLDNVDLDALSSDIDEEMDSFDLNADGEALDKDEIQADDLDLDSVASTVESSVVEGEGAVDTKETTVELDTIEDDFDHFDDDLDLLDGEDECSTKLELAQAYMDMGDAESAKEILDEVVSAGDDAQQEQARKLLEDVT